MVMKEKELSRWGVCVCVCVSICLAGRDVEEGAVGMLRVDVKILHHILSS